MKNTVLEEGIRKLIEYITQSGNNTILLQAGLNSAERNALRKKAVSSSNNSSNRVDETEG